MVNYLIYEVLKAHLPKMTEVEINELTDQVEKRLELKHEVKFEKLPVYNRKGTIKEGEDFLSLSGVLDIERRCTIVENMTGFPIVHMEDFVGMVTRKDGGSNFANVERDLAHLNGCDVEVRIKIVAFPKPQKETT